MLERPSSHQLRFGDFALDVDAYELRRRGRVVRLERLAMDLLLLLVDRRGQLVARNEIVDRLWGQDVFLEVDASVNTLVRKVRRALGDPVDHPRFIQTVQGKGYRFIAEVEVSSAVAAPQPPAVSEPLAPPAATPPVQPDAISRRKPLATLLVASIASVLVLAAIGWAAWARFGQHPAPLRVAVMPIDNFGGDPALDYLTDGLTEETAASLGQIIDAERVTVIGRMSTRSYKGTTKSVSEIGRDLRADYLIVGSIRAENGRLRVTSSLVRVNDQEQVWSDTYEREPKSLLAMQQELGRAVAQEIRLRLSPELVEGLAQRQTSNAEANDLYLRGRYLGNQLTPASTLRALEAYGRATSLDPNYALAWSGIADALTQGTISGDIRPLTVWPRAREAADRALKAGPMLAETHTSVGLQQFFFGWNWRRSEEDFRAAIAIDPTNPMAHRVLGVVLSHMKRADEARRELRRARDLEPGHAVNDALSAMIEFHAGDMEAAVTLARQGVALDPDFWVARFHLAQAYEQLGQSDRALEEIGIGGRLSNSNSKALSLRGYILAKTQRRGEANDILALLEQLSATRYVPAYARALVHLGLGNLDEAFVWLDKSFEERDVHLVFLTVDPKWDPVRTDPRFQNLVARCGFASDPVDAAGGGR